MLAFSKLWVKFQGTNAKRLHPRTPVPSLLPEYKVSTLYSAPALCPNSGQFWRGYWILSVSTLVPSLEFFPGTVAGHQM